MHLLPVIEIIMQNREEKAETKFLYLLFIWSWKVKTSSRAQQVGDDTLPGTILVEILGEFDERRVGGQTQICAIHVQESA